MQLPRLYISEGNSKTGKIPSVSLPPLITCPIDAPCRSRKKCYACRLLAMRPSWKKTLYDNLALWEKAPAIFFNKINAYLEYVNTRFFRWNIAGDLPCINYFKDIIITAKNTPDIKHLLFTKRFEYPLRLFKNIPDNLSVVFSYWNNYGDPSLPVCKAWYYDPKDPDPRIPDTAIECSGNCEACGMCWNLKKIKKDVYFHKH